MNKLYSAIKKVTEKEPMFTTLVNELVPKEDKEIQTLATDGEFLFYNPDFLNTLTEDESAGVVLHEALHCAFQHMWRKQKRDMEKWNIATDYSINTIVTESFPLPKGCLLDSKYYGLSAEQIYDMLPKSKNKRQSWCDKSKWPGQSDKGKKKNKSPGGVSDVISKIKKAFGGKDEEKEKEREKKLNSPKIQERWEKIFEKTFIENYGKMPDSVKRIIEKDYYIPVIDWSALVSNLLSEDTNDYTFSVPDRRFMESDFVLPDLYSVDRLKDVVFAYDTSGSISKEDLFVFYMETLNLFNNFSSLAGWIAICDAYLHSFKQVNPQQTFNEFDFVGGGGTNFCPVFDEIKKRGIKPKALFYFTDTEGDFPDKDPGYPVYWLVKSQVGDNYPRQVPFGQVIKFASYR